MRSEEEIEDRINEFQEEKDKIIGTTSGAREERVFIRVQQDILEWVLE